MKKWLLTAAIVLATATAANAGWTRCETIRVFPGFSIQHCESSPRHAYGNHYRSHLKNWKYYQGNRHNTYAWNHKRFNRHYRGNKPYLDRKNHDRRYRRGYGRW